MENPFAKEDVPTSSDCTLRQYLKATAPLGGYNQALVCVIDRDKHCAPLQTLSKEDLAWALGSKGTAQLSSGHPVNIVWVPDVDQYAQP